METYSIPTQVSIGHVHLKVSDLDKSIAFYVDLLGFSIKQKMGTQAAFIAAGNYHHHIGLNTWYSKNEPPASTKSPGLFHVAILYPTRKDLAVILKRLIDNKYPLTGAADHGVSEALYLNDIDGNGIELYWDKPQEKWPIDENGNLQMVTERLDIDNLLQELHK